MKTLECSEANLPLADYAKKLKKAPVIITEEGKPLAALISLIGADMETVSLSNNPIKAIFPQAVEKSFRLSFRLQLFLGHQVKDCQKCLQI